MGGIRRQRKGKMGDGGDMGRNKERERKGKMGEGRDMGREL